MVSSIVPGAGGVGGSFGVDPRNARPNTQASPQSLARDAQGDRVEVSAGALAGARESVNEALHQLDAALAFGRTAQALLATAQAAAKGEVSQDALDSAIASYSEQLEAATTEGGLLAGEDLIVQAEPGAPPLVIAGADFSLGGAVVTIAADAQADDPTLAVQAQRSLDAVQRTLRGFSDSAEGLATHQGFLSAAESAFGVRGDLNADSARLMALQVRQGLEAAGAMPIANAEPQAVLSLFRA